MLVLPLSVWWEEKTWASPMAMLQPTSPRPVDIIPPQSTQTSHIPSLQRPPGSLHCRLDQWVRRIELVWQARAAHSLKGLMSDINYFIFLYLRYLINKKHCKIVKIGIESVLEMYFHKVFSIFFFTINSLLENVNFFSLFLSEQRQRQENCSKKLISGGREGRNWLDEHNIWTRTVDQKRDILKGVHKSKPVFNYNPPPPQKKIWTEMLSVVSDEVIIFGSKETVELLGQWKHARIQRGDRE